MEELLRIISKGKDMPEQFVFLTVLNAIPLPLADEVRMRHGKELEVAAVVDCAQRYLIYELIFHILNIFDCAKSLRTNH